MKSYHPISERFAARFAAEHARILDSIESLARANPADADLARLAGFFRKTAVALSRHRYRVVEWKERAEKFELLYSESAARQLIRDLIRLLSEVLTETKKQN